MNVRIIVAILILGLVIFFHELGHFLLAKANHIVVLEFALGMGPRILSFQRGETTYAWKLLPFGGSCSMLGEDDPETQGQKGSFQQAALWRRAFVVAAGPCFNFIMAMIGAMILIGAAGADPAVVLEVPQGSPAQEAGLQEGDLILRYDGNGIANASELYTDLILGDIPTDEIRLVVEREGERIPIRYAPETETSYKLGFYYQDTGDQDGVLITRLSSGSVLRDAGLLSGDILTALNGQEIHDTEELQAYLQQHPLDGSPVTVSIRRSGHDLTLEDLEPRMEQNAYLGFSFNLDREKQGFAGWLQYSFAEVRYWIHVVFKSLACLFNGTFSVQEMSGPVGIVNTIGDAYEEARPLGIGITLLTLINMIILLSANLGVMNLLPFPALDGGRLLLMLIEGIRRKPLDPRIEARINMTGLLLLMAFMIYITAHDIFKLI